MVQRVPGPVVFCEEEACGVGFQGGVLLFEQGFEETFGGMGGGCQRLRLRRLDSSPSNRVSRGVRWACISADDGSRVSITMPVDMS
jgi:hypothetical protein